MTRAAPVHMGGPWLVLKDPSDWVPARLRDERFIAMIVGFSFLLAVTRQVIRPTPQEKARAEAQKAGEGFFARAMAAGKAKAMAEKPSLAAKAAPVPKPTKSTAGPAKKEKGNTKKKRA